MSYAEIGQIVSGATGFLLLFFTGYGLANLRFKVPGTAYFVALTVAGAVWCFGYAFEKSQVLVEGFLTASKIEVLGLAFLPTLWLMVALSWIEHPLARSRWFRAFFFGVSLSLVVVVWTNGSHHWWYQTVVPTGRPGFAWFEKGPLYFPYFGILISTFFLSSLLLFLKRKTIPLFRQKALIILTANLFPTVFAAAFQLGLRPGGLDLTLFSLIPAFSVLAVGLFRHDFIRIVPIARDTVVESLEQAVLVHDVTGRLVDHNAAAHAHLQPFDQALRLATGARGEVSLDLPEGTRTFRFRRTPVHSPAGQFQGTVVILNDITEDKRLHDELAHQASHDALTGVANRRHFEGHALGEITRAGRHGGTLALVIFDLDWFKSINDRFGHPAGDRVLRSVASVIVPRLRTYDLLARIGGEEFAVLMPEANLDEACEAAERWRLALEGTQQVLPGGTVVTVTASFGVTTMDDLPPSLHGEARAKLDTLLGLADRALYRAKAEGRNRVCR